MLVLSWSLHNSCSFFSTIVISISFATSFMLIKNTLTACKTKYSSFKYALPLLGSWKIVVRIFFLSSFYWYSDIYIWRESEIDPISLWVDASQFWIASFSQLSIAGVVLQTSYITNLFNKEQVTCIKTNVHTQYWSWFPDKTPDLWHRPAVFNSLLPEVLVANQNAPCRN